MTTYLGMLPKPDRCFATQRHDPTTTLTCAHKQGSPINALLSMAV